MNLAISDQLQVVLKVSGVTRVVSAMLADDVYGHNAKEDLVVPTYGVQETCNVTRPVVPSVQMQDVDDFDVDLLRHPIIVKASNSPKNLWRIIHNSVKPRQDELRRSGWHFNGLDPVRWNWGCVKRCLSFGTAALFDPPFFGLDWGATTERPDVRDGTLGLLFGSTDLRPPMLRLIVITQVPQAIGIFDIEMTKKAGPWCNKS